jgi:hypothetical protein
MKRRSFFAGITGVISAVVVGSKVKGENPIRTASIKSLKSVNESIEKLRSIHEESKRRVYALSQLNDGDFVSTKGKLHIYSNGLLRPVLNPITELKSHPEDATKILQFISSSDFEMTEIVSIPGGVSIVGKSQFDSCSIHLTATSAKYNKSTRQGWTSFDVKSPKVVEFIQGLGYAFN